MKLSELSKELLSESLLLLMHKQDYSSITIKDIAQKAGVSRLTFYRNFDSKEQILTWHIEKGFQSYLSAFAESQTPDLKNAIALCFSFWAERSDEIKLFIRQNLTHILQEPFASCMYTLIGQMGILQNLSAMQRQFLIGGMFADMVEWISSGMRTTPEAAATEILSMFSDEFLRRT